MQDLSLTLPEQERRPSDPNKNFVPGDFTKLFQKALETVDLVFSDGIDWQTFLTSFQKLQVECNSYKLSIQAIERKSGGAFVVRVEVPPGANKGELEKLFKRKYLQLLKAKEKEFERLLKDKDKDIVYFREQISYLREQCTSLTDIIKEQAANQNIKITNLINAESSSMSENSQQNVNQNVGNNTGQMQAFAAGRDVNASQIMDQAEAVDEITQQEAVELLTKIEELIKTANLPLDVVEEATKYVGKAKEEAEEKDPQHSIVLRQLDRATVTIKKLDTTAGTASDLISKLKPFFVKLAGWLGVAVNYFFGG